MTASEILRATALEMRDQSEVHARHHAFYAQWLLQGDLTPAERLMLETLAKVRDCQARRHKQWADQFEVAASEAAEL